MPREGIEMKDRLEAFVVQGTNESFATTDNHMLFMSPIVNPPIMNSMDTGLHSANWPSVDYSVLRGNAATTVQLIDPTTSLNYIQQQQSQHPQQQQSIHQTLPTNTQHQVSHVIAQTPHTNNTHSVVQPQHQPHQAHAGIVEVSPVHGGQQAMGQLLHTVVQSSGPNQTVNLQPHVFVTNQHIATNMWHSTAPPPGPPHAPSQPSLIVSHVHHQQTPQLPVQSTELLQQAPHQQPITYVNVGVQAGGMDADGNPTLDPMLETHPTAISKLPAKKRLSQMAQASGTSTSHLVTSAPAKKRSKMSSDKKRLKHTTDAATNGKELKRKKAAMRKKKRNCNPNLWKKNIRKLSRVQGQAYINSRGKFVPARTRSGPPCSCRMRCYDRILEEECNEIFQRFLQIADKDIQDALLYSLITKEEVKHRKGQKVFRDGAEQSDPPECGESPEGRHNVRNATFLYHVQCKEGIVRVCSTAFSSIYGASQKRIRRLQQHKFIDPLNPPVDLRGKHGHQKEASGRRLELGSDKTLGVSLVTPKMKSQAVGEHRMRTDLVNEGIAFCVNKLSQNPSTSNHLHESSINHQSNKPVDYSVITSQHQGFILSNEQHHQAPHFGEQAEMADSGGIEASNFLGGFLLGASGASEMKLLNHYGTTAESISVKNQTGGHLQDTVQQTVKLAVGNTSDEKVANNKDSKAGGSKQSGRSSHPELWKKNIRKKNRAHGMAYINTKGKLVPAKSRSGPPCHCRMRCYLRINEEQCNKIFSDFHNIGDKNVQDGLLYNLTIHKEVKKKRQKSPRVDYQNMVLTNSEQLGVVGGSSEETTDIKEKVPYQADLLDLIFNENDKDAEENARTANEMQDKFVQHLVHGSMGEIANTSSTQQHGPDDNGGFTGIINLSTRDISANQNVTGIDFSTSTLDGQQGEDLTVGNRMTKNGSPNHKIRDRQSTFWYYVQLNSGLVRVCSTAFMSIYGATQKRVRRLQQHKVLNPITPPKDMRGRHCNNIFYTKSKDKAADTGTKSFRKSSTGKKTKTGGGSGNHNTNDTVKMMAETSENEAAQHNHNPVHQQQPQHHHMQHADVLGNRIIMVSPEIMSSHNALPPPPQLTTAGGHIQPQLQDPASAGIFLQSQIGALHPMNLAGGQSQLWQQQQQTAVAPPPQQHPGQSNTLH